MAEVTGKLKQVTVSDPLGREPDPWADFRDVEVIALHWSQSYRHSLGKYSRFFLELENGRFMATRCARCDKVWTPPRPACPDCLAVTQWVELSGRGELASWSVLHHVPVMAADHLQTPYVLAYVKMEGADTLFAHLLQNYGDLSRIHHGMSVQVVYGERPVDHPLMLMAFEPVNTDRE